MSVITETGTKRKAKRPIAPPVEFDFKELTEDKRLKKLEELAAANPESVHSYAKRDSNPDDLLVDQKEVIDQKGHMGDPIVKQPREYVEHKRAMYAAYSRESVVDIADPENDIDQQRRPKIRR